MNKKNRKTLVCFFVFTLLLSFSCKKKNEEKKSSQTQKNQDDNKKDLSDFDDEKPVDDAGVVQDDTVTDNDDAGQSIDDVTDDSLSGDNDTDDVIPSKSEFEACPVDVTNPSSDCGPDFVCFPKEPNGKDGICAKICEDSDTCTSYTGKVCKGKNAPGGKPICHTENKKEFDSCDQSLLQFCNSTSGLSCVTYSDQNGNSFEPLCLKACDPTKQDSCAGNDGTYCYSTDNKNGYCWKVGVEHEECGVKAASVCDETHLCVSNDGASQSKCYRLCPNGQTSECPTEASKCVGFQDGNNTINACIPE